MEKKIKKAYKFRIYPNVSQKQQIEKTLGCVRQVYNDFLEMMRANFYHKKYVKKDHYPAFEELGSH